jgi:hypothetical protein
MPSRGPPGAFRGGSGAVQGGPKWWEFMGGSGAVRLLKGGERRFSDSSGGAVQRPFKAVQGQFMPERTPHRRYSISGTPRKLIQGCKRGSCPSKTQRNHHGDTTGPLENNPPPPQPSAGHQEGLLCTRNKSRNLLLKGLFHEMVKP